MNEQHGRWKQELVNQNEIACTVDANDKDWVLYRVIVLGRFEPVILLFHRRPSLNLREFEVFDISVA